MKIPFLKKLIGGKSNKLVSLLMSSVLAFVGWQAFVGPMFNQYQRTGSVTVPLVGVKVKLPDVPGIRGSGGIGGMLEGIPGIGSLAKGSSGGGGVFNLGGNSAGNSSEALTVLNKLPVKGRAPKTGYSRDQFGPAWTDKAKNVAMAGNGCDTRNDILKRDLTNITLDKNKCTVLSGILKDPYTGKTINFKRGPESAKVQIDHIVALGNAWVTGAQQLSKDQRTALANDPLNLVSADGPANGQKSDGDAATWLPPNKGARCSYVTAQINVKKKYHLWVTAAEKNAMTQVLARCG